MKKALICFSFAMLVALPAFAAEKKAEAKPRMLRHVVIFKFKADAKAAEVEKVVVAFGDLKKKIPQIAAYEWGSNNSPENLNKGFTHCFTLSFKTEKDRDAYLPNPEHKAFVGLLKPVLEEAFVIDYWTN
ncbi:MAG: Dabb family protein [Pedosphaera sp.]|nr:Dabb family protein [Pedosphaera sp.]